jgi:hypothetical protein
MVNEELNVPSPQTDSYITRHWRGELPLPISYWINSILIVGLGCNVAVMLSTILFHVNARTALETGRPPSAIGAITLVAIVLYFFATLWATVGTWRAASRYRGAFWGRVTKLTIIFGVFISVGMLISCLEIIVPIMEALARSRL